MTVLSYILIALSIVCALCAIAAAIIIPIVVVNAKKKRTKSQNECASQQSTDENEQA